MILDYQQILDLFTDMIVKALPISVFLAVAEKAITLFFSLAFGDKKVKL